jgi:hypothetical protein
MGRKISLEGMRFGKLVVLAEHPERRGNTIMWVCKCDCGNTKIINGNNLRQGKSTTCGCSTRRHGMRFTRLWRIWDGMMKRCYNPKHKWFKRYGGRGITICEEWLQNHGSFFSWALSNGYKDGLTIDRIDVDKGYCPENCRWVDMKTQLNNRSNNCVVEINGESRTLAEWADITGIGYQTIYRRYRRGERGDHLIREVKA